VLCVVLLMSESEDFNYRIYLNNIKYNNEHIIYFALPRTPLGDHTIEYVHGSIQQVGSIFISPTHMKSFPFKIKNMSFHQICFWFRNKLEFSEF
jgi:hypothetical protein